MLFQPQDQAGIDAPRPGGHDQPVERRESHGGVDGAAVAHRRERRPGPEVAGDQPHAIEGAPQELSRAPRGIGVGESVEAVLAQVPALAPLGWDRVGSGPRRHARVECRIEAGDRGHLRENGGDRRERVERLRLVERGKIGAGAEVRHDLAVDPDGLRVARSPVDDPVPDGVDRPEPADGARHGGGVGQPSGRGQVRRPDDLVSRVEHPELQAARPRIDDEDSHRSAPFSRARTSPGPRDRRRPPGACRPVRAGAGRPSSGGRGRPAGRGPARGRSRRSRGGTGRGR